jgi:hypothetical protein
MDNISCLSSCYHFLEEFYCMLRSSRALLYTTEKLSSEKGSIFNTIMPCHICNQCVTLHDVIEITYSELWQKVALCHWQVVEYLQHIQTHF